MVSTPPAKAGGFGLRLKAGSAGPDGRLHNPEVVIRLRRLLVLDVLLPHIVCDVPAGAYPIPSRPQMLPPNSVFVDSRTPIATYANSAPSDIAPPAILTGWAGSRSACARDSG